MSSVEVGYWARLRGSRSFDLYYAPYGNEFRPIVIVRYQDPFGEDYVVFTDIRRFVGLPGFFSSLDIRQYIQSPSLVFVYYDNSRTVALYKSNEPSDYRYMTISYNLPFGPQSDALFSSRFIPEDVSLFAVDGDNNMYGYTGNEIRIFNRYGDLIKSVTLPISGESIITPISLYNGYVYIFNEYDNRLYYFNANESTPTVKYFDLTPPDDEYYGPVPHNLRVNVKPFVPFVSEGSSTVWIAYVTGDNELRSVAVDLGDYVMYVLDRQLYRHDVYDVFILRDLVIDVSTGAVRRVEGINVGNGETLETVVPVYRRSGSIAVMAVGVRRELALAKTRDSNLT